MPSKKQSGQNTRENTRGETDDLYIPESPQIGENILKALPRNRNNEQLGEPAAAHRDQGVRRGELGLSVIACLSQYLPQLGWPFRIPTDSIEGWIPSDSFGSRHNRPDQALESMHAVRAFRAFAGMRQ